MILIGLLIYFIGYVLAYILTRYLLKYPWGEYVNEDMLFNFRISLGSWFTVFVVITILTGNYYKNHKPKVFKNLSNWYSIWKNKESKL